MKIAWFGLYRREPTDVLKPDLPEGAITAIDVSSIPPHDTAVVAVWRAVQEPEDHPNLGTTAILVRPDGSSDVLSALNAGSDVVGFGHIQALEFRENGQHTVEIRPIPMRQIGRDAPSNLTPSERVLAVLPLFVTGVRPPPD